MTMRKFISKAAGLISVLAITLTILGCNQLTTPETPAASSSASSASAKKETVVKPVFSVNAGEVAKGTKVTITTTTKDATIYYTTDGKDPTTSSTKYTEAVEIKTACTVKAIAVKDGMTNSDIASASYTLKYVATYKFTETVQPLPDETTGTAGTSGKYVLFGDWPQTLAASNIKFNTKPESNGYYVGSDGNYYAYCLENAVTPGYKYADGITKVQESSANSYKYFKVEPIKWRVLTDNYDYDGDSGTDTAKLFLAENILMANVTYYMYDSSSNTRNIGSDTTIYPNNYKYSMIRAWLNGLDYYNDSNNAVNDYNGKGFLQMAFTSAAQSNIKTTKVNNKKETTGYSSETYAEKYACEDTEDKIFLLSESEVINTSYGFTAYNNDGKGNTRIRATTDYAKANYASTLDLGGPWWLRSPHKENGNIAYYINSSGSAKNGMCVDDSPEYGIVPALTISY